MNRKKTLCVKKSGVFSMLYSLFEEIPTKSRSFLGKSKWTPYYQKYSFLELNFSFVELNFSFVELSFSFVELSFSFLKLSLTFGSRMFNMMYPNMVNYRPHPPLGSAASLCEEPLPLKGGERLPPPFAEETPQALPSLQGEGQGWGL